MNAKVDEYIQNQERWHQELEVLRKIILDCGLTEEIKWRAPCYTFKGQNVLVIGALKDSCVLSFFKGALLQDAKQVLSKPGENTQAARVIKFRNIGEIESIRPILKSYIFEALELEKAGLKVDFDDKHTLQFSEELQRELDENPAFKMAFTRLTPGRQRGYNLYFSAPKQAKSRNARIEKYKQRILDGKGINDCVCGLSKKPPVCDGSNKFIKE